MIQPHELPGAIGASGNITDFPAPVLKFRPVANHLILQYQRPGKVGEIIMPIQMKALDTIICEVLAVGPDCKQVKAGERVLILTKALVGGPNGLLVEGQSVFVTQEQTVIAVVE